MKQCQCGSPGPFYRNASRPDGLSFYCKACTARQRREEYARKYPDGKGKRGAQYGNQNRLVHGRYIGYRSRIKQRKARPVMPEPSYLDKLIRMPLAKS